MNKPKDTKNQKVYKKRIKRRGKSPPMNHQKKRGPKER